MFCVYGALVLHLLWLSLGLENEKHRTGGSEAEGYKAICYLGGFASISRQRVVALSETTKR